jgi:hypothetical protein
MKIADLVEQQRIERPPPAPFSPCQFERRTARAMIQEISSTDHFEWTPKKMISYEQKDF